MDPTNATTQIKLMDIMSHDSVSTLFGVSLLTDIWGDAVRSRIIVNIWFWKTNSWYLFNDIDIFMCFYSWWFVSELCLCVRCKFIQLHGSFQPQVGAQQQQSKTGLEPKQSKRRSSSKALVTGQVAKWCFLPSDQLVSAVFLPSGR